jgi:hypothetical protein
MPLGIDRIQRPLAFDDEARARIAATIARVYRSPVDPAAKNLIRVLADILRQRASAGWNTPLSPETTMLVAEALDAYAPDSCPADEYKGPDDYLRIDLYASGSTVYRVRSDGEIAEVAAWAKSTIVASAAFRKLVEQYPNDEFLQKRKSWVENP